MQMAGTDVEKLLEDPVFKQGFICGGAVSSENNRRVLAQFLRKAVQGKSPRYSMDTLVRRLRITREGASRALHELVEIYPVMTAGHSKYVEDCEGREDRGSVTVMRYARPGPYSIRKEFVELLLGMPQMHRYLRD